MKLLLINPRIPESFWSFKWAVATLLPGTRVVNPPLGLATLAGLCPPEWEIEIVDENVESIPLEPDADIIGVGGMGIQFARQSELLSYYRSKGYRVVAGGSYASLKPERYESIADTVVSGEAEYVWKEFCRDAEAGCTRALYREEGTVELADSPTPRFDLLRVGEYQTASMQFSRGCPYRCEFCDIIVMFGRRPRTKTMTQIEAELDALRRLDFHNVFFVDDNLIGDKKAARRLLEFLREYQDRHDYAFHFGTEASMDLAREPELMELMRAAHFEWVFVGIESPDPGSLRETGKSQNLRGDLLSSVRTIYGHGIDVLAGFIIGFDHDTVDTFDRQYRFIVDSGIQAAMVGLLMAVERTPLHERLRREGRLIEGAGSSDNTKLATNVIPKRMTYDEMITGYRDLQCRLAEFRSIGERVRNKIRHFGDPPVQTSRSAAEALRVVGRVVCRVLARGKVAGAVHFVRSVPFHRPRLIPLAIHDWALGLSIRDYVDRELSPAVVRERRRVERSVERIRRSLDRYSRQCSLALSLEEVRHAQLRISIRPEGGLGTDFFTRAGRQLERMLRHTKAGLVLRIEGMHHLDVECLRGMLEQLKAYGDRIVVAADHETRRRLDLDTSVFRVALLGS